MKRAIFEWGVILLTAFSCVGAVYWGVSVVTDVTDFQLTLRDAEPPVQMATHAGKVCFCDHFANAEVIEAIDRGLGIEPKPTKNISWRIPGVEFHHIGFANSSPVWSLDISLLIPVLVCALLSLACFRGFRRVTRRAMNQGMTEGLPLPSKPVVDT